MLPRCSYLLPASLKASSLGQTLAPWMPKIIWHCQHHHGELSSAFSCPQNPACSLASSAMQLGCTAHTQLTHLVHVHGEARSLTLEGALTVASLYPHHCISAWPSEIEWPSPDKLSEDGHCHGHLHIPTLSTASGTLVPPKVLLNKGRTAFLLRGLSI